MQDDIQQTVEELLAVESEANEIVERARAEARRLRSEGVEAAEAARQEVLAQARQMAEKMLSDATTRAEAERDRRLAQNGQELERLERLARQRKAVAVQYVVAQLKGEERPPQQLPSRRSAA